MDVSDSVTALVVLLPDAAPLLDRIRELVPELVRPLPAHVSLLYPGPPAIARDDIERVAGELPEEVEMAEPVTGADGFVGIAVPQLDALLARVRARYPEVVPYQGRFGAAPRAHLTLAMGADATQERMVRRRAAKFLPCRARPHGPVFVRRTSAGWRPVESVT